MQVVCAILYLIDEIFEDLGLYGGNLGDEFEDIMDAFIQDLMRCRR